MKLVGYEWMKLIKQLRIWFLTVLLLAGNLLLLYAGQKNTPTYFFIFNQKDSYHAFCKGDITADAMGFYQQELDDQESYIASYQQFISEMRDRAAKMSETAFYEDVDSYLSRNLQKTCQDFSIFADAVITADNCYGLRAFAQYDHGILFLLIFLGIWTWYILFYERNCSLLLLYKGCRRGHYPLAIAKLTTLLMGSAVYVLFQEGSTILCFGYMYGYGDLSRPVQSASIFRNCFYVLTVGQAIGAVVLVRLGIALVIGALMFAVGVWMRNEAGAVLAVSVVLVGEYALNKLLFLNGSMNLLKIVNPFFYWSMKQSLGCYLNLNFFGYAVEKDIWAMIGALIFMVLFASFGMVVFHCTCQIKCEGYWERWLQWLRGKWNRMNQRVSLLYYEFYKLLYQQKKRIAVALLLIWAFHSVSNVHAPQYYASAKEAAYHVYLETLSGPVTDETLNYLKEEDARFQQLREKILSYGANVSGAEVFELQMLQFEIERMEDGFRQVQMQMEALAEKPGSLTDKYLLDEVLYNKLWQDTDHEVFLWFAGSVVLLFFLCGIYTADEGSEMLGLLRSMRKGRKHLERNKNAAALFCTIFVYVAVEAPLLLAYAHIDGFSTGGQQLCNLVKWNCSSTVTLHAFELTVFILKGLSFLLSALIGRRIAKMLKQGMPAFLVGSGLFAITALIFVRFEWSLHMLLLQLL